MVPMRKSLSQSWSSVRESKVVARVTTVGLSGMASATFVMHAERLFKPMTPVRTKGEVTRGEVKDLGFVTKKVGDFS